MKENEMVGARGMFCAARIAATEPTLIWYEANWFLFSNLAILHLHHNAWMHVAITLLHPV